MLYASLHGFIEVIGIYSIAVIETTNNSFISIIMIFSSLAAYLYSILWADITKCVINNWSQYDMKRIKNAIIFGLSSLSLLYLVRFMSSANEYVILLSITVCSMIVTVASVHATCEMNLLIELAANQARDGEDHMRNLS